jgi:Uma2 family endonuclease
MTALARLDRSSSQRLTVDAFDVWLDCQSDPSQFELLDGGVVMMANPTETHNQIVSNIQAPLKLAMDLRKYQTYAADMRVQRSDRSNEIDRTKRDVVVRCGAHTGKAFITDPIVVVDVSSPSTIDIDRGVKLDFYKSLQPVMHVALVYQDQQRVEHYKRTDAGWDLQVLNKPDDILRFDAVDYATTLDRIYFDLEI